MAASALWFSEAGRTAARYADLSACFLQPQTSMVGGEILVKCECSTVFPPSELCCIWQMGFWQENNTLSSGMT